MKTLAERFEEKFIPEPNTGCWLWEAGCFSTGYGLFRVGGKLKLAHRVAYSLYASPIPAGLCVLHRCDVRTCVNPAHLWLGTKADNNNDCRAKGRTTRGAKNGSAKLTENQVVEIRAAEGLSQRGLAAKYGISQKQISDILRGVLWSYLL